MDKKISIVIPEEMAEKIQSLAEESCRSRPAYIRQIIKRYLRKIEENPAEKV